MTKTILVTGSTRGIGFGLASSFVQAGHNVVVNGRTEQSTSAAVARLAAERGTECVLGVAADVSDPSQVESMMRAAAERFGHVDIWINNAGLGSAGAPVWEQSAEQVSAVVGTNLTGLMNCCRVAIRAMIANGSGAVYNMEGLGSRGPVVPGTSLYGATKAAVTRFTRALVKDTAGTPVRVGFLSPGMVLTDLFTGGNEEDMATGAKRAANILGDRVETVAPYLAHRVLSDTKHGTRIDWLPGWKIGWRFATAAFRRNRLIKVD